MKKVRCKRCGWWHSADVVTEGLCPVLTAQKSKRRTLTTASPVVWREGDDPPQN